MAADFGLLVARFNTATPTYNVDNDLRELRIDAGGRVYTRLADGNNNTVSWFADNDAVGSGVGGDTAGDRGVLILGKNDTNSNYQILRVNDDGSLAVSFNAGTDVSEAASNTGTWAANDEVGEVALTVGQWVLVQNIAVTSGKIHIDGWSFGSDKNTVFQIVHYDDTGADGVDRTDATALLDTQITTSARPSDHVGFMRAITRSGAANNGIAVFAKQLQSGAAGVAWSMINAHTTT